MYFKQYNYRMYQTQEVSILIYITCNYFQLSKSNWKSFGSITELKLLKQSSGRLPLLRFSSTYFSTVAILEIKEKGINFFITAAF